MFVSSSISLIYNVWLLSYKDLFISREQKMANYSAVSNALLNKLTKEKVDLYVLNTVILIIFVVVSVIGNAVVLYVYVVKIKTISDDRYFIPHLAAIDMLTCVTGVSFGLLLNFNPLHYRNDLACRIIWFAITICLLCSGMMLLGIAIQRYIKVCKPFMGQLSNRNKRLAIAVMVLFSSISASPSLYLYGESEFKVMIDDYNITAYTCGTVAYAGRGFLFGYSIYLLLLCIIAISAIVFLYSGILKTVFRQESFRRKHMSKKKSKNEISSDNRLDNRKYSVDTKCSETSNDISCSQTETMDEQSRTTKSRKASLEQNSTCLNDTCTGQHWRSKFRPTLNRVFRKHKISIMFTLIAAIFVLSFLPRLVLMILEATISGFWDNLSDWEYLLCLCLNRVYLLNNVVNPVIYYGFDRVFRKGCKRICR